MAKGDRPKCVFTTWPHSANANFRPPSSVGRKTFAKMIEEARNGLFTQMENIAVFQEAHKDGRRHFHCLVTFAAKAGRIWQIDQKMFEMHNAKTFTEVVHGDCTKPQHRVLRYLMVPTPEKPYVDEQPYIANEKLVPTSLVDEALKSKARLASKAATPDEIYRFLCTADHITSYDDFLSYLDKSLGSDLVAKRMSKYVNNNICRAKEIISGLINRRGHKFAQEESRRKPRWYVREAIRKCGHCCCPKNGKTTLFDDIEFLVDLHGHDVLTPFFSWADNFFGGTLPLVGRPKNCFFLGCPSSGKPTLSDLVARILPRSRIFSPTLESSAPYADLRPHHLLSVCDDWRFTPKVPIAATLQWLEGRQFGVDIKGKDPFVLQSGPVCLYSSNRDSETTNWKRIDLDAFHQRCYLVVLKTPIPPKYRTNVGDKAQKCMNCSLRALARFVPSVAKVWGDKQPCAQAAPAKKGEKPASAAENELTCAAEVRGAEKPPQRSDFEQEAKSVNEQKKGGRAEGGIDPFDNPFGDGNLFDYGNPFDEGNSFDDGLCDIWGENEL